MPKAIAIATDALALPVANEATATIKVAVEVDHASPSEADEANEIEVKFEKAE